MEFIEWLREFNIATVIIRLFLAFLLGGLVGFERQKKGHAAGLRTHILVCVGATLTTLTGLFITEISGYASDPMRIGAQVVSGIGFIGAGTIMVTRGNHIRGLTTAAGLWATAAIGLSLGAGFYEGALAATLLIAFVIILLKKLDRFLGIRRNYLELYVEVCGTGNVNNVIDCLKESIADIHDLEITPPRSGKPGNVGMNIDVYSYKRKIKGEKEITDSIRKVEFVDIVLVS